MRSAAGFARSEHTSVRAADYLATCVLGASISVALPAATGVPTTPVWALALMYAMFNGGDHDIHPSVPVLVVHTLAPLATIPVFLALGAPLAPAISARCSKGSRWT